MKTWLSALFIDGHEIPVIIDPDANWIEVVGHQPCPDCGAARKAAFASAILERLRIAGLRAYEDGRADSENIEGLDTFL